MASIDFYIEVEDHTGASKDGRMTYPVAFACEEQTLLVPLGTGFLLQLPSNRDSIANIKNICQWLLDSIDKQPLESVAVSKWGLDEREKEKT